MTEDQKPDIEDDVPLNTQAGTDEVYEGPIVTEPEPVAVPNIKDNEGDVVKQQKQKVKIESTPFIKEGEWNDGDITISMPSSDEEHTREVLEDLPNVNIMDTDQTRDWGNTLSEGAELCTFGNAFKDTLEDQDADFSQSVEHAGQHFHAQAPRLKEVTGENIRGERAMLRVIRELGLGTTFQVPLYHSGFWITLKPPSESELIELNRLLVNEKIRIGRYTYGLVYSHMTSYTVNYLMDFILAHVYSTTVKSEQFPISDLKKYIKAQDLFTVIWAMGCTMYPRGLQYRRSCINNPERCNHVVEERINLQKLQIVNTARLNQWQRSHMAMRQQNTRDKESVQKYIDELVCMKNRTVTLVHKLTKSKIVITLKSPTVADYVDEGHKWVSEIVEKVTDGLESTANNEERNKIIQRHAQASTMRQYGHWVESIEINTNIIDDRETINLTLETMSADDTVREEFIEAVVKYINDSTISVVGIPAYNCPKCGTNQADSAINDEYTDIIPLDVIQLFFALSTQRIQRIAVR